MKRTQTKCTFLVVVLVLAFLLGGMPAFAADDNTLTIDMVGNRAGTMSYTVSFRNKEYDDLVSDKEFNSTNYSGTLKYDPDANFLPYKVLIDELGLMPEQEATVTFSAVADDEKTTSVASVVNKKEPTVKQGSLESELLIIEVNGDGTDSITISFVGLEDQHDFTDTIIDGEIAQGSPELGLPKLTYQKIGDGEGSINGVQSYTSPVEDSYKTDDGWWKIPLVAKAKDDSSEFVGWYSDFEGTKLLSKDDNYIVSILKDNVTVFAKFIKVQDLPGTLTPQGGDVALPKTGGVPLMVVSTAGVGLLSLGLLFRKKRNYRDMD